MQGSLLHLQLSLSLFLTISHTLGQSRTRPRKAVPLATGQQKPKRTAFVLLTVIISKAQGDKTNHPTSPRPAPRQNLGLLSSQSLCSLTCFSSLCISQLQIPSAGLELLSLTPLWEKKMLVQRRESSCPRPHFVLCIKQSWEATSQPGAWGASQEPGGEQPCWTRPHVHTHMHEHYIFPRRP